MIDATSTIMVADSGAAASHNEPWNRILALFAVGGATGAFWWVL